jgi:hypothetical protein
MAENASVSSETQKWLSDFIYLWHNVFMELAATVEAIIVVFDQLPGENDRLTLQGSLQSTLYRNYI